MSIHQAWLWVFTNPLATVFNIAQQEGRSAKAMAEVLCPEFAGALISDFYVVYDSFEGLKELSTADQALLSGFASELTTILREALGLKKTKSETPECEYTVCCKSLEERLDLCLQQYAILADSDASAGPEMWGRRLVNRARKYRDELFLFLYEDAVPGTNNVSESRIRKGVCARKTQGCHRTQAGADRYAYSCSIIATEKQLDRDALTKLIGLVKQARAPNAA